MSTYYTLLGVPSDASAEDIEVAYQRQRERYDPARVAALDVELRQLADQRSSELQRAYQVLADPTRRRQYDSSLDSVATAAAAERVRRTRAISPREWLMAGIGGLAALALVAFVWMFTSGGTPVAQEMGRVDRPAPAISLAALGGGAIDLANYKNQVVLVNFWGTWCEPCKRELPALQEAYTRLKDKGFVVIGVNLTDDERARGNDEQQIKAFLDQYQVSYPIALDSEGAVTNAYRVFPLPTSFFIDAAGRIRYVHVGELSLADVETRFQELR